VAFRKRSAGTGLQIPLESDRRPLMRELNGHDNPPWAMHDRLARWAMVVPLQSLIDIGGKADVVAIRITLAAEDVDETFADAAHCGEHTQSTYQLAAGSLWVYRNRRRTRIAVLATGGRRVQRSV
jgi:hypothetical protein